MDINIKQICYKILSVDERIILENYFKYDTLSFSIKDTEISRSIGNEIDTIAKNMPFGKFVWLSLMGFDYKKCYSACYKIISYAEDNMYLLNPTERNYFYSACIKLFYKPKNLEVCNYDKAEEYCLKQMENWDEFRCFYKVEKTKKIKEHLRKLHDIGIYNDEEYLNKLNNLPNYDMGTCNQLYTQLIKIYERQGKIDSAMEACANALIKVGNCDGTKGGFIGRYARLKKKKEKK